VREARPWSCQMGVATKSSASLVSLPGKRVRSAQKPHAASREVHLAT
jgi:hypothetical protein